jgi:hypothetical protein
MECGKKYYLSRIAKAPQLPSWWFVGGKAVHAVTEKYDRMRANAVDQAFHLSSVWERLFEIEIEEAKAVEPDDSKWRCGKNAERYSEWNAIGPEMVRAYIAWRKRMPYELWTTPDGLPAIELDVSGRLPGCDMEIKGFLDRVFIDPNLKSMWVVDIKSGKTKPKGPLQFGTYGALLTVKYGITPHSGAAWMGRDGVLGTPYSLAKYTPTYVGKLLGHTERAVKAGAFAPSGNGCFLCDVSSACYAQDGPLAAKYDPDHPAYAVPF